MAAGIGLGLTCARRLRRRVDDLCRIERLLDVLCDRLVYSAQPLAVLWQTLAEDEWLSDYPLVQETAADLCKGFPFYISFSRAVEGLTDSGRLTPASAALLTELGGTLGHSGLDGQAGLIRRCGDRLKKERQAAEELARVRVRLYPMVGLASGVSLALLLL